jgi:HlyD family secretion protein
MFDVDLVFTDEVPDNIRIGKTYRVQIELGQPEDALTIEKGSFYQSTGGQWIFKLDKSGNKAVRTNITIGRQNPGQYEVLKGLSEGDKVIISGYSSFGDAQELVLKK